MYMLALYIAMPCGDALCILYRHGVIVHFQCDTVGNALLRIPNLVHRLRHMCLVSVPFLGCL